MTECARHESCYMEVAPSGVEVHSTAKRLPLTKWDTNIVLFYFWSEWTWTKRVWLGLKNTIKTRSRGELRIHRDGS